MNIHKTIPNQAYQESSWTYTLKFKMCNDSADVLNPNLRVFATSFFSDPLYPLSVTRTNGTSDRMSQRWA